MAHSAVSPNARGPKGEELACCRDVGAKSRQGVLEKALLNESLAAGGSARGFLLNRIVAAVVDLILIVALAIGLWSGFIGEIKSDTSTAWRLLSGFVAFAIYWGVSLILGRSPGVWLSRLKFESTELFGFRAHFLRIPFLAELCSKHLVADGWRARHRPMIANLLCVYMLMAALVTSLPIVALWSFGGQTMSLELFSENSYWDEFRTGAAMGILGLTDEDIARGTYLSWKDVGYYSPPLLWQFLMFMTMFYQLFRMKWRIFLQLYAFFYCVAAIFSLSFVAAEHQVGLLELSSKFLAGMFFPAVIFLQCHTTMRKWDDQHSKHMKITYRYLQEKYAASGSNAV
jgi:hypothetical protein